MKIRISTDRFLEFFAVVLSLLYTLLYLRGVIPSCYYAAFFGSALFTWLCWRRKIYAESFLQLFYVGLAVYGYTHTDDNWVIKETTLSAHLPYLLAGGVLTVFTGAGLRRFTDARTPFIDAFTTVFSLIATWFMINYIVENWLYWIVIDAVSIFLYAFRRLWMSAVLFFIYLLMAIDGYVDTIQWFTP